MNERRAERQFRRMRIVAAMAAVGLAGVGAFAQVTRTEQAFPTGERATSIILLERAIPTEVRAGVDFEYQIKITNLTRSSIMGIELTEKMPGAFRIKETGPRPRMPDAHTAIWRIDALAGGASQLFRVKGASNSNEKLDFCATVAFDTTLCISNRIVEPRIALTKTIPADVMLCEAIPLRLVVTNTGSATLRRVTVTDALPAGLLTSDGRNGLAFDAGDLAPGQSREFTASLKAGGVGRYTNTAVATEAGGVSAEASATTTVHQPALAVTKRGPGMRYVGRTATFEITVQNTGDASANDTVLVDVLPAGTQFVEADRDGRFADGKVTWHLGTLSPRESVTVRMTVKALQIGRMRNTAMARAFCAEGSGMAEVEIRGIPAILLEVVDDPDPIEVGSAVTYSITVTNQGSAIDSNIEIECTLPEELEYASSSGPTQAVVTGKTVKFAPLATLAPKAKVTFTVVAKGTEVGDVRFKTIMNSDNTTSSVEETESTRVY